MVDDGNYQQLNFIKLCSKVDERKENERENQNTAKLRLHIHTILQIKIITSWNVTPPSPNLQLMACKYFSVYRNAK